MYIKEYLTTFVATMSMLSAGEHLGWPSPTLPKLKLHDSPLKITDDEGSWIVSILIFGYMFGPLPTGFLMNRIGRKATVVMTAIPYLTAWILILVAESVSVIYVAQFLAGIGSGMSCTVVPLYLGEIASDQIRGALGTTVSSMSNIGIVIAYCLGPYVPYGILPYILMVPSIILLLSYFILPETPYFYLMKHREEDAMASLKYLRNHNNIKDLQAELDEMKISVKKDQEQQGTFMELFSIKGNRKAFFIVLGCFLGQQLCGSQSVLGYAEEIFTEVDGDLGPSEAAIVLGVVQLVIAFIAAFIVDRMGRRLLLLISTGGVTVTSAIIGGYFYMMYYLKADVSSISWLSVLCVMLYIILYTVGLSIVPYILLGELFPTNVKAIAAVPIIMIASLFSFAVSKLYQVVSDLFGTYISFWGFSFLSFLSLIHVFFTLPETKGKSLAKIQINLNK